MKINILLKKYENKIDNLDLELIIAHVLRQRREFLIAHPEFKIKRLKDWKIKKLIKKREQGFIYYKGKIFTGRLSSNLKKLKII